jgi:predicted  nucleic acid-binding Zn-ribbon protein
MIKLLWFALGVGAGVAFVGLDVVGATVRHARESVRATLTSAVPLRTQLAEARVQVDAYAESVIRGEIAAENLAETVVRTEREVRARRASLERERGALAAMKTEIERRGTTSLVGAETSPAPKAPSDLERDALRRARDYQAASVILERRERDLAGLKADHRATLDEVERAKQGQARLAEEVSVLEAEVQALEARTAVAQTRKACDAACDTSGFGEAEARLQAIRDRIKEQNRKLEYYALRADASRGAEAGDPFSEGSAAEVLEAVLAPADR